jgi:hypothetical protein
MAITIPTPNTADLKELLKGKKTYIALASGMAVIALNHFGMLPPDLAKSVNLDPANWVNDEYKLILGATGRAALAGIKSAFDTYLAHARTAVPPPLDRAGAPGAGGAG